MTDLPRCKLCQCSVRMEEGIYFGDGTPFLKHPKNSCVLAWREFSEQQWTALMGVDRDAVRYRWLREQHKKHLGLTICAVGMYDLVPWSGDDPDSAIDSAMGEQQ